MTPAEHRAAPDKRPDHFERIEGRLGRIVGPLSKIFGGQFALSQLLMQEVDQAHERKGGIRRQAPARRRSVRPGEALPASLEAARAQLAILNSKDCGFWHILDHQQKQKIIRYGG